MLARLFSRPPPASASLLPRGIVTRAASDGGSLLHSSPHEELLTDMASMDRVANRHAIGEFNIIHSRKLEEPSRILTSYKQKTKII